jgi:hypothetical protein
MSYTIDLELPQAANKAGEITGPTPPLVLYPAKLGLLIVLIRMAQMNGRRLH